MHNEKFYDGSFFDLDNPAHRILMSDARRSFGRTSYWLNRLIKRAESNELKKFIYFRRKKAEIEDVIAKGFGKNLLLTDYYGAYFRKKGLTITTEGTKIYLSGQKKMQVGYFGAFNGIKGVDLDDVDVVLFDEYIAPLRSEYKGGNAGTREPFLLNSFLHTALRRRMCASLIFLGNQDTIDSPTNPYKEYYHIPFKAKKFKRDDIGLFYRDEEGQGDTGSFADVVSRANEKTYSNAVKGDRLTGAADVFIVNKPPCASYIAAIKYQGDYITLWVDFKTDILYCHDNYKIDRTRPFYSAFNDDMTVDSSMLIASQFPQLKYIKERYITNQIRYNNQRTASRMRDVLEML